MDSLTLRRRVMMDSPHPVIATPASLVTFDTNMVGKLKDCKVHFSPVQSGSGDPSPDNVRPISGWNGVEVSRCGKNLLNPTIALSSNSQVNPDGSITQNIRDASDWPKRPYMILPAGTYDFHSCFGAGYTSRYQFDSGTEIDFINKKTITITETTKIRFKTAFGTTYPVTGWLQIFRAGEDYEESKYVGTTLPIDWTDDLGTIYGGYVDLVRGEVVEEWAAVDLGSLNWSYNTGNNFFNSEKLPMPRVQAGYSPLICSEYVFSGRGSVQIMANAPSGTIWYFGGTNDAPVARVKDIAYSDVASFKAAVSGVQLVYKLAEPIHHPIDPVTLKTLRGINNVWSDANGDIELTYWKH